jgi:hypothetical protein
MNPSHALHAEETHASVVTKFSRSPIPCPLSRNGEAAGRREHSTGERGSRYQAATVHGVASLSFSPD